MILAKVLRRHELGQQQAIQPLFWVNKETGARSSTPSELTLECQQTGPFGIHKQAKAQAKAAELLLFYYLPDFYGAVFSYHNSVAVLDGFQKLVAQLVHSDYSFSGPHVGHNQSACGQGIYVLGKQHRFRGDTHLGQSLPHRPG
jgi:hypothetical protein